MEVGDGVEK